MTQEPRVQCAHCDGPRDPNASVAGSYCSTECYYRDKGEGILSELEHDHTVCSTCFATLKEIETPRQDDPDCYVGIEHPTVNATRADGAPHPADTDELGVLRPEPSTHTPLACRCGAIENERDETIERIEGADVLLNLWGQLCRLYTQGAIDNAPSKDRLFDGLREQGRDWAYAIGVSVWGGDEQT